MFNVCPKCGIYRADKLINKEGSFAICPECAHEHRFKMLPLFVVTGASGSGKTAACLQLAEILTEAVALEGDVFWNPAYIGSGDEYGSYRDFCLRVCKNISQNGRPVVLCGSAIPQQYESCVERRYFSSLHTIALVCSEVELSRRLRARPQWRDSGTDEFIAEHIKFNQWFIDNADSKDFPMKLIDTSAMQPAETARIIAHWVRERVISEE